MSLRYRFEFLDAETTVCHRSLLLQFKRSRPDQRKSNLPNLDPARPHYGPKDFAWTLRALSGVLKASPKPPGPRFGASSGRNREKKDLPHQRNSQRLHCNIAQF